MAIDAALGRLGNKSGVCTSSTRPTNPFEGQLIYETDTNRTLVYDNAAWLVVADNQVLSIDSANGRVGVGTTTPSTKLQVDGTITATAFTGQSTSFPTSLDTGTLSSIQELQAKVGVNGSAVTTSLDARVNGSPAVLVYDFAGHAMTANTYNIINFDRESYDTHGMHDTTTLNERITIPSGWSGYYNVFWGGIMSTGTGQMSVFYPGGGVPIVYGDGGTERSACSAVIYLSAGQSIQIQAYPTANSTLYGAGTIGGISPFFGATWLRP